MRHSAVPAHFSTPFGSQTRYPEEKTEVFAEDAPEPTAEQGAEAVAHARAARDILMSALG